MFYGTKELSVYPAKIVLKDDFLIKVFEIYENLSEFVKEEFVISTFKIYPFEVVF